MEARPIFLSFAVQLHPSEPSGTEQYVTITLEIRRITSSRVHVIASSRLSNSPDPTPPVGWAWMTCTPPRGVTVYLPRNALFSPVYISISRFDHFVCPRRILVTAILNEWLAGIRETI
ncbi:hypothetical protein C8Q70DRAFT_266645 [Cubamyces menziesii]|nr:hypothetical protein C8Q70DRAFT_266645 [Cubamyces menziesii]